MSQCKRAFALLLSLALLLSCAPISAFAPDEQSTASSEEAVTLYIHPGTTIYKTTAADAECYTISLSYAITVVKTLYDENQNPVWYEFDFEGLLGNVILSSYKYVKVTDASASSEPSDSGLPTEPSEPEEEHECTCENPPERLSQHADSCPRKQYILGLIQNDNGTYKTAAQIYADWLTYDAQTRTDVLDMVKEYVPTEYDILLGLIADGEVLDSVTYEEFESGKTPNGIGVHVSAVKGSFPEGTELSVSDVTVDSSKYSNLIPYSSLGAVAVDISFGGQQPSSNVVVTMSIPGGSVPNDANMVYIIHITDGGAEVITSQYLNTSVSGQSITFGASSFSSYIAVFVNSKYNSKKLSEVLKNDTRYSIHDFNVLLFDYDPIKMNEVLTSIGGDQPFLFRGYASPLTQTGTHGVNDSSEKYAKQGILESTLLNGLPKFRYLGGTNGDTLTAQALFSKDYAADGKTTYDIKFEFVYDSETGYYQYKSSANHAQYNSSNNKIELYADTLSTQNKYAYQVDLTAYTKGNGYKDFDISSGVFKAKAYATSSSGTQRHDPYVYFPLGDGGVDASEVQKIYVKAKIPASVGKNTFMIYFKHDGEKSDVSRSYEVNYTATGDYIEFVIDTSTNTYWDGTITSLRIDLFDSFLGTLNTSETYDIEIAQISLITEKDDYVTRGGFYPFTDIADSYPGNGDAFSQSNWQSLMTDDDAINALASRSIFNPNFGKDYEAANKNLFFGLVMEFDFYIPVDKKVNGQDLKYIFSGDDDLWVFVDGELVLDIGGGHGGIAGTVNFTTGNSMVNSAVTVNGYDSTTETAQSVTKTLSEALCSPGKHTMKIFYMERCGSVSNCFMKFNLPQTPQTTVVVEKSVVDESNISIGALKNDAFTFQISGTWNDLPAKPLNVNGLGYDLYDSLTGQTTKQTVGTDGKFTLTATQKATFYIDEHYNLTITELSPASELHGYGYVSTTVNGNTALSATQLTVKDKKLTYSFVNVYKPLYGTIVIQKSGIQQYDHDTVTEQQSSIFRISGTSDSGIEISIDVVIVGNGSRTIVHVPVGNYVVTELDNWTWRYQPDSSSKTANVLGNETATVSFVNTREKPFWLSGDNYDWNLFTIEKKKDS